jgi:two-component system sensor histidine kinase AgrC
MIAIINIFNKDTFKILFTFPFIVILIKYIYEIEYSNAIVYSIFSVFYAFFGELIAGMLLSILPFNNSFIFNNILGTTTGTLLVTFFTLLVLKIKKINIKISKIAMEINEKYNNILMVFTIFFIGIIAYKISVDMDNVINLVINSSIVIIILISAFMYYKEKQTVKELSNNYNEMFEYLEKYEKELVEKRKIIHDYKNQLIVINSYIGDDKKLKEYISELIKDEKNNKKNSMIQNIDKLPRGLKGLIYYKLAHIDNKIIVILQVNNSLKKFDNINPKLSKDVLKIIGILLDNAIEAVNEEKEKFISIEFSIRKNTFIMSMRNSCSKNIKISNVTEMGFSTKGKNRGYGMSLVKDILSKNDNIKLDIKIENKEFISNLEFEI